MADNSLRDRYKGTYEYGANGIVTGTVSAATATRREIIAVLKTLSRSRRAGDTYFIVRV